MSQREQALKRQLEAERQLRPVELNRLYASFPELKELIRDLHGLLEAADPRQGRNIETARGHGEQDGTQMRGDHQISLRGGLDTRYWREQIHRINLDLLRFRRRVYEGDPTSVPQGKYSRRRCRRAGCRMKDRWQYGYAKDGHVVCYDCGCPMPPTAEQEPK